MQRVASLASGPTWGPESGEADFEGGKGIGGDSVILCARGGLAVLAPGEQEGVESLVFRVDKPVVGDSSFGMDSMSPSGKPLSWLRCP
jgi:hypothetical protein